VPIGIRFEARPESAAHKNMVVGDQNAKRQESLQGVRLIPYTRSEQA
jgi:hypothetical protein